MAKETKDKDKELEQLRRRLDTLDQRLDDIDSMVTAIAERAMSRPITLMITCPNCGKTIEVGMVGNEKMMR